MHRLQIVVLGRFRWGEYWFGRLLKRIKKALAATHAIAELVDSGEDDWWPGANDCDELMVVVGREAKPERVESLRNFSRAAPLPLFVVVIGGEWSLPDARFDMRGDVDRDVFEAELLASLRRAMTPASAPLDADSGSFDQIDWKDEEEGAPDDIDVRSDQAMKPRAAKKEPAIDLRRRLGARAKPPLATEPKSTLTGDASGDVWKEITGALAKPKGIAADVEPVPDPAGADVPDNVAGALPDLDVGADWPFERPEATPAAESPPDPVPPPPSFALPGPPPDAPPPDAPPFSRAPTSAPPQVAPARAEPAQLATPQVAPARAEPAQSAPPRPPAPASTPPTSAPVYVKPVMPQSSPFAGPGAGGSGAASTTTTPPPLFPPRDTSQHVAISSVVPAAVRPARPFTVEIAFHLPQQPPTDPGRVIVAAPAALSLSSGTALTVRLTPPPQFTVEDADAPVEWIPPSARAQFLVTAAAATPDGVYPARVEIFRGELRVSRFYVSLAVAHDATELAAPVETAASHLPRTAFASYAHLDRERVLERVDSLVTAGIKVFVDCLDLAQGQHWEDEIEVAVIGQDKFFLFWSTAAAASPWVQREWTTAYTVRGLDYIEPHALESPDVAPPPQALSALQFGSVLLRIR